MQNLYPNVKKVIQFRGSMYQIISAIYENGVLKPAYDLPFEEGQQVLLLILQSTKPAHAQPNQKRVAHLLTM